MYSCIPNISDQSIRLRIRRISQENLYKAVRTEQYIDMYVIRGRSLLFHPVLLLYGWTFVIDRRQYSAVYSIVCSLYLLIPFSRVYSNTQKEYGREKIGNHKDPCIWDGTCCAYSFPSSCFRLISAHLPSSFFFFSALFQWWQTWRMIMFGRNAKRPRNYGSFCFFSFCSILNSLS
jgi:hypothetical protein